MSMWLAYVEEEDTDGAGGRGQGLGRLDWGKCITGDKTGRRNYIGCIQPYIESI